MLKLIFVVTSLFLNIIIFLRVPKENVGLTSFASQSDLLGSPSSAQRLLNILTTSAIVIYFGIAMQLNLIDC